MNDELLQQMIIDYVEEYISDNTNDVMTEIMYCTTMTEVQIIIETIITQFLSENEAELKEYFENIPPLSPPGQI